MRSPTAAFVVDRREHRREDHQPEGAALPSERHRIAAAEVVDGRLLTDVRRALMEAIPEPDTQVRTVAELGPFSRRRCR